MPATLAVEQEEGEERRRRREDDSQGRGWGKLECAPVLLLLVIITMIAMHTFHQNG
jgi:hypothetical protein